MSNVPLPLAVLVAKVLPLRLSSPISVSVTTRRHFLLSYSYLGMSSWVTSSFLALSFLQIYETCCPKSLLLQERRLHSSLHFHNTSWLQPLDPQTRSVHQGLVVPSCLASCRRAGRGEAQLVVEEGTYGRIPGAKPESRGEAVKGKGWR